jgi:hypothetical protein
MKHQTKRSEKKETNMNDTIHQYLAVGQDVIYVGPDGAIKAKITAVYGDHDARIEWDNGVAIATHSFEDEPGTFHFEQASPKEETNEIEAQNKIKE